MAERIQLRRTKGYRKPEGAIVVARPSRWGNPYRGPDGIDVFAGEIKGCVADPWGASYPLPIRIIAEAIHELAGRDLACWCALDRPCHADLLIALANDETIHLSPLLGDAVTPCCGRTPFELPRSDRLTVHDVLVTCSGSGER